MVVHPFCSVADLDALGQLADDLNVPILEDCAQAHGARWRGSRVGTHGTVGCFSMQQSKVLTCGEGGAVITGDDALHDRLEQLRCDGRRFSEKPVEGQLELVEVGAVQGRNLCMSEFHAAILLDRLQHVDEENRHRSECAAYLESCIGSIDGVSVLTCDERVSERTFYNFVLRMDLGAFEGNSIDAISRALTAELGTPVHPVYVPLNRHRLLCPRNLPRGNMSDDELARLDLTRYALPEAEKARRTCLTLTHPVFLSDRRGMDEIVAAIQKVQRLAGELVRLPQGASTQAF